MHPIPGGRTRGCQEEGRSAQTFLAPRASRLAPGLGDTSGGDFGSRRVIRCEGKPWVSPAPEWCKSGAELLRPLCTCGCPLDGAQSSRDLPAEAVPALKWVVCPSVPRLVPCAALPASLGWVQTADGGSQPAPEPL